MLDIKCLDSSITIIKQDGVEQFLKAHSFVESSDIDGIFHHTSLLPTFEKIIFFDFGKNKELSLVLSDRDIKLSDIIKNFSLAKSNYDFRDDISKIEIEDCCYIIVEGKVDLSQHPIRSTDARGNIKSADQIEVRAIIVEVDRYQ